MLAAGGRAQYIGQTGRPYNREKNQKKLYPHLSFEPIGECATGVEMDMWEWIFIELLKPSLNICPGGEKANIHLVPQARKNFLRGQRTDEVRKKRSQQMKERNEKWGNPTPTKASGGVY